MRRLFKKRFSMAETIGLLVLMVLSVTAVGYAVTTVPHIFTAGTTAKASEVNTNFSALANAIDTNVSTLNNKIDTNVSTLTSAIAQRAIRIIRHGTCSVTGPNTVLAPEVTLSSPPQVQVWIASSGSVPVRIQPLPVVVNLNTGVGVVVAPGIAEGSVTFECVAGWVFSLVVIG